MWLQKALVATLALITAASIVGCGGAVTQASSGISTTSSNNSSLAPSIAAVSPSSAVVSSTVTLQVSGSGYNTDSVILWNGTTIATTFVNSSTVSAQLSVSTLAQPGDVDILVQDAKGLQQSNHVKFYVLAPLSITTTSVPSTSSGTVYSTTLTATGGQTPYKWSLASGTLPSGITLNTNSGALAGTPSQSGTFSFTVSAIDSETTPAVASQSLSLVVQAAVPALSITTVNLPSGQVSTAYNATAAATGGVSPYTWSVYSGALPTGLSLVSSTGAISGTPSSSGTFNVTLAVQDAVGMTTRANFTLTIAALAALQITTAVLPNGVEGSPYTAAVAVSGGTPPYTWNISSGSLPSTVALGATTGSIQGTPTTSGTFTPTVQVMDSANKTANQSYSLVVAPPTGTGTGISSPLLTGMTASHYTVPNGWTVIDHNGFTTGTNGLTPVETLYNGSQNCSVSNTGSAYGSSCTFDTYVNRNYNGIGIEIAGTNINSREVYGSFWQYSQQANPGYGLVYTDWYPFVRGHSIGGNDLNPGWQPSQNCTLNYNPSLTPPQGGCNPAQMVMWASGNGVTTPAWAVWSGTTSFDELLGQWVQYEVHIKANTPGQDDGDMEIWQNGTLMMQVNKTAHAGCYFGGYTGSGPQTCGNLNGSDDFTQLPLWIGGDWGAIVPTITYDDTKHRMMCTGGTYNGNAVTADEACPPSGYIPYWHNYITDVIVMVPQ